MKKMMLLTGLLVLGAMGYAAEATFGYEAQDSFKAHVKVIKPLNIEADDTLEFGTVVIGQQSVKTKNPLNFIITGEVGKVIKISYLMNGELMKNHNVIMKTSGSQDTITGYLVNKDGSTFENEQLLRLDNGNVKKEIYGMITTVPNIASGDYYSDPITIKVQYQ